MTVRIPPDNEKSNLIRIEGDPQGVQEAKKELLDLASRMVKYSAGKLGQVHASQFWASWMHPNWGETLIRRATEPMHHQAASNPGEAQHRVSDAN